MAKPAADAPTINVSASNDIGRGYRVATRTATASPEPPTSLLGRELERRQAGLGKASSEGSIGDRLSAKAAMASTVVIVTLYYLAPIQKIKSVPVWESLSVGR